MSPQTRFHDPYPFWEPQPCIYNIYIYIHIYICIVILEEIEYVCFNTIPFSCHVFNCPYSIRMTFYIYNIYIYSVSFYTLLHILSKYIYIYTYAYRTIPPSELAYPLRSFSPKSSKAHAPQDGHVALGWHFGGLCSADARHPCGAFHRVPGRCHGDLPVAYPGWVKYIVMPGNTRSYGDEDS